MTSFWVSVRLRGRLLKVGADWWMVEICSRLIAGLAVGEVTAFVYIVMICLLGRPVGRAATCHG